METAESTSSMKQQQQVLDGSNIMKLVGNEEVFSSFVDHKFQELDRDRDGQLSVKELQPAVADICAALGLPAQGSSPDSDHIYSECSAQLSTYYFLYVGTKKAGIKYEGGPVALHQLADCVAQPLKEQPVIVAHSENIFDGSGIKRLLSNKFELDKTRTAALEIVPKDHNGKLSKDYLRVALDAVAASASLPRIGAVAQDFGT
ncbi:calcium-binding EF-hand family protein [Citrus sinensis]|nr:calcium-binding EF-hand family protein [Citrus sinensis]